MKPEEIEEIRKRAEKATEGPWYHDDDMVRMTGKCDVKFHNGCAVAIALEIHDKGRMHADFNFIAHARQDIPDLLSALEAAQKEVANRAHFESEYRKQIESSQREVEGLRGALKEIAQNLKVVSDIPFYAYGNNEAACTMAHAVQNSINALARAEKKVK